MYFWLLWIPIQLLLNGEKDMSFRLKLIINLRFCKTCGNCRELSFFSSTSSGDSAQINWKDSDDPFWVDTFNWKRTLHELKILIHCNYQLILLWVMDVLQLLWVPLVGQELLNPSRAPKFISSISRVHVFQSLACWVVFYKSLFGFLSFLFWPLYCLSFFHLQLLTTPLVSCGHCIVCPSSIYSFWLLLWYLVAIVLSVLLPFTASDYSFGILRPLYCLSFFHLQLLTTPLVSCGHCIVCLSSSGHCIVCPSFGHCIVCPSSIYSFWLLLWYLQT